MIGGHRHLGAHLDGGAADLTAALRVVDIAGEQSAAVDEAREQQGGADHRFLGVEIAAVLARRNRAHAFILRRAAGAAEVRRQRIDRLRRERRAARIGQRLFALEPLVDFRLAGQHADRTHERIHGNGDARQVLRARFEAVQLPVNDEGIAEHVAQEAEARHDGGVAEIIGRDVDDSDGDRVAAFRPIDEDRPGERMHQVEIYRRDVLRLGIEGQVGIERVARLEHEKLPGRDMGGGLDL